MNQRTREKGKLSNMKMLMLMPRRTTFRETIGKYRNLLSCITYGAIIKALKVDIYLQLHCRCQWNSVLEPAQGHYKLVLLDTVCRRRFLEGRNTQAYKVPVAECCLHSYSQQDKEHIEESVPIKIKKGMKIALEVLSHEKSQASRGKMSRFQALLAIRKCCLILNKSYSKFLMATPCKVSPGRNLEFAFYLLRRQHRSDNAFSLIEPGQSNWLESWMK